MKTFIKYLEEKEIKEVFGKSLLTAGAMALGGFNQASAAPPPTANPVQYKIYQQAKVVSMEEKGGRIAVVITLPYSKTFESVKLGMHKQIAKNKAMESVAAKLGVRENDLELDGAESPQVGDRIANYTFYIKKY